MKKLHAQFLLSAGPVWRWGGNPKIDAQIPPGILLASSGLGIPEIGSAAERNRNKKEIFGLRRRAKIQFFLYSKISPG